MSKNMKEKSIRNNPTDAVLEIINLVESGYADPRTIRAVSSFNNVVITYKPFPNIGFQEEPLDEVIKSRESQENNKNDNVEPKEIPTPAEKEKPKRRSRKKSSD